MRWITPFLPPLAASLFIGSYAYRDCQVAHRAEAIAADAAAMAEEARPIRGELTFAPNVPAPTKRTRPAHVVIDIEIKEVTLLRAPRRR
jgi:hypothetical protein